MAATFLLVTRESGSCKRDGSIYVSKTRRFTVSKALRARAMLQGRLAPDADDVVAMAQPVLTHRMALSFAARARGESLAEIIAAVAEDVTRVEAAA